MPVPPSDVTSSAVSSMVSGRLYSDRCVLVVRPVQTTVAPASPSAAAMPRPAPRVAPATNAIRPRSAFESGDQGMAGNLDPADVVRAEPGPVLGRGVAAQLDQLDHPGPLAAPRFEQLEHGLVRRAGL